MLRQLKVVFIASECVPFAKTGGLADVVGALPGALNKLGHEVIVIMPLYGNIDQRRFNIQPLMSTMGVWMGNTEEWCSVYETRNVDDVPIYFIEFENYFARDGLYHDDDMNDYLDNPLRFSFLSRAGLQLCKDMDFRPDIVHVHDWQTALATAYLKIWHWNDPGLSKTASVLTIHNIGYQGKYPADHYDYTGLQLGNFTSDKFEDYGGINYLKGGIQYADMVTTVSPKYALETKTPEGGQGMAPYLNDKKDFYIGILNGVDYSAWSPEIDEFIPERYSIEDMSGKAICKKEMQLRFGMLTDPGIPVIGVVSRFADQKGLDLLAGCIDSILGNMQVQFVILGSGDRTLEGFFSNLPSRFPNHVGCHIGYHNELAHWIEAGSDFFVMPSRYEPCGLNQIYSLKYGTLPIVRGTGGLDDTVEQYNEETGTGTGFKYWELSSRALYYTIGWAVSTYYDRPQHIDHMRTQGMLQSYTWEASAIKYVSAYHRAIKAKALYDK